MIEIVLATRNAHKVMEVQRILDAICDDITVVDLSAWPDAPEVVEDAPTFAGNALLKARALAAHTGKPTMADDSGICVDALNGMPGIFSARWSGSHGNDAQNLQLLLDQLQDVPDSRRSAQFACAVALATPEGDERVVEGVVDGEIVRAPRGVDGFGYDPIFQPYGYDRTTAELTAEEKDAISHRGQALRAFVPVAMDLLAPAQGCGANCQCRAAAE
jgi:XTP/dITP diphosphohydrolase